MPIRRAVATPFAVCAAVATLLAVSGCDLADREERSRTDEPASTASHPPLTSTEPESPGGGRSKLRTSTVTLDGAVLRVAARKAVVVEADEGTPGLQTVTLSLAPGGAARLALVSPGALDVDTDGSITVLDGNGTPVAAVGPPAPPSGTEDDAPRIEVTDTDATHARVAVDDRIRRAQGTGAAGEAGPAGPLRVTFVVGTQAIDSATWGENEGGRSLAVDPADWARHAGQAGVDLIRTQLVAAEPDAGTATMGDQLVCHAVGAPDKATWNLEPWRPDVGLILTATAQCNPV
ncbi:DUF2599 domain-containing protein [Promicromonospora sp. NPDC057138]|uniref:DUF2599 domain-containing protein n=1 Tax=Promicromonospora sp. NPDC057138 TaxID=3346031 RepID=UPI0036352C73